MTLGKQKHASDGWPGLRRCAAIVALAVLLAAGSGLTTPVQAQQSLVPVEQQLQELLDQAEAYQAGYLQVVAVCCYQLYSSCGVVATDFANGYIDAGTALFALDENGLLHSVCYSTLTAIRDVTPAGDTVALAEIDRLLGLLAVEGELLSALRDVCIEPTDERAAAVESARRRVEQALDAYTAAPDEM